MGISGSHDAQQKEAIIAAQLPILNEGKITKPAAQANNDKTNEVPINVRQKPKSFIHQCVQGNVFTHQIAI